MKRYLIAAIALLSFLQLLQTASAADPATRPAEVIKPVPPPPEHELSAVDRAALQSGADALGKEIESLRSALKNKPAMLALLPDVEIYYNAVRYPLKYDESIDPKAGRKALADGMARAEALRKGETPWTLVSGPRGYVSQIDDSVQPYILNMPADYKPAEHYRLDVSCHGRNEKLMELNFITQSVSTPAGKFVLNLYGRYCCANKMAGEIDCLEAMDSVQHQYPIDENRILMIGFSMGGAACWQFATHYTDHWAAASPGAGFAETKEFLKIFAKEDVAPPWYEQVLWHCYDCTDYAANLYNLPTIAYAGELDTQKQASDIMMQAMEAEGLQLQRIIGPKTKHAYEKNAKIDLDKRLDSLLAEGRKPMPEKIRFTTWTLRYNQMFWVTVNGLDHHWQRARVDADRVSQPGKVVARTQNVSALTLALPVQDVVLDGTEIAIPANRKAAFTKADGQWKLTEAGDRPAETLKRHGLQGPIDDAFLNRFLIVRPTLKPLLDKEADWTKAECEHAITHWRKQFRGEPRVKDDKDVTETDIAESNLILFGDPSSNSVMGRLADKLPVHWNARHVTLGSHTFPAENHVPVMIYPDPLNPQKYVVLNSGFTFREYDYMNNARQIPKLPDYAVVDISSPSTPHAPGSIAAAGFFGEHWELLTDDGQADTAKLTH